jgi:hypothetical protein
MIGGDRDRKAMDQRLAIALSISFPMLTESRIDWILRRTCAYS